MSNPNALTIRFRGVRGSIPCTNPQMSRYGGNTSCVEVRNGDQLLILDAGTGIRGLGENLRAEFGSRAISASLLISHTHWDHIQGLPFFAPAYSSENNIRIIAPAGRLAAMEHALRNQMDPIYFPVGFEQMNGLREIAELVSDHARVGSFSVDVVVLNHPGGCVGFRIEANGVAIGYLPDHEPYKNANGGADTRQIALIDFVRELDLLILDTQFTETEYQRHITWGHGSLPESVALAINGNVRRLALFHHDPSHNDEQIDQMVEAARKLASRTRLIVFGASENGTTVIESASSPTAELAAQNSFATA